MKAVAMQARNVARGSRRHPGVRKPGPAQAEHRLTALRRGNPGGPLPTMALRY